MLSNPSTIACFLHNPDLILRVHTHTHMQKGVVYCVGVYNRASGQIPSMGLDWDRGTWKCVCSATQEASARVLLQVLIDGTGVGITCYVLLSKLHWF